MNDPTPPSKSRSWTPAQLAAIDHIHGDLVVSAAAGSGKTAVLAERCARLVAQPSHAAADRTGIENLLVLTFTEAAAGEMRSRIAAALREKMHAAPASEQSWLRRQVALVDRASISTLHAFCMRILRQHFHEAGVDPAFDIMDQEESQLLQDEVLDDLLAQWHALPLKSPSPAVPGELSGPAFADFFEAFAQGRPAICRLLILGLHRMLVSTADAPAYIAASRALYAQSAVETFDAYQREVLQDRIRLARLQIQRSLDEVRPLLGAEKMAQGLEQSMVALDESIDVLASHGSLSWGTVKTLLEFKWPTLRTVDSVSDFAGLKERNWEAAKKSLKELAPLFAPDPARMLADLQSLAQPFETLLAMTLLFDAAFTAAKRRDNRLDFADLEREAYALLIGPHSLARDEIRQRYHHLLVDEFQDINPLQAALLDAMRNPAAARNQGNLFVVGDIKQSIYAFRLAQPELFLSRERDARARQHVHPRSTLAFVPLQNNFRSRPDLLAAMNGIFEKILTPPVVGINYADGHELQPPPARNDNPVAAPQPSGTFTGTPVEVHLVAMDSTTDPDEDDQPDQSDDAAEDASDDKSRLLGSAPPPERLNAVEQEAQVVAERIAALLQEGRFVHDKGELVPLQARHIAILLRTMKSKAMLFARALADRGIGVHADLSSGFFDTPEVQDTLALLHLLDNPQQDIPMATVLLGPFGQFSPNDLALIRQSFDRKEVPFAVAAAAYPLAADPDRSAVPQRTTVPISSNLAARLASFFSILERWRQMLRGRPLHEGLAEIFAESKILAYVAGLDTGAQRVANLQYLHQRALKFSTFKKQGLHRFLRFIEKLREQETLGRGGGDIGEAPILSEASDVVHILSIHKSKGLEFPVVFVSGLGGKLRLTAQGPMLLHRDLGVGLYVSDLDRNVSYPSAAALRVAHAQRKEFRAEELRLLYVALTRARECLILTGHVAKSEDLDKWRQAWEGHRGPLPEDMLLKGTRALDWLMPALASLSGLRIEDDAAPFIVRLHPPKTPADATPDPAEMQAIVQKIVRAEPIEVQMSHADAARVERMVQRVTGTYPFAEMARQPAVQTVSFLKTAELDRASAEETAAVAAPDLAWDQMELEVEPDAADLAEAEVSAHPLAAHARPEAAIAQAFEAARLRGIATHRILELLDFATCDSQAALDDQVAAMITGKRLTQSQADDADWDGIRWFLWHSSTGARVIAAARRSAAADSPVQMRREIGFAWVAPLSPGLSVRAPAQVEDWPTVRGVIDLLLLNGNHAEIVDYKTDSVRRWESRLDDYRRQMGYYLSAASEILGFRVQRATLVFLRARQEVEVLAQNRS